MIMRIALCALVLMTGPALAQGAHEMASGPTAGSAPSTKAYRDAMTKMHREMDIPYTDNPDRDFVAGMIPHHQGAIDMAQVELQYGKDTALRRLAREIIAAQQKEIAFMRQWQAHHVR